MKIFSLILLLAIAGIAQSDLPDIGKLSDIQGKTKVYLTAEAPRLKYIKKEFDKQKTLQAVDKPSDADFIIEYRVLRVDRVTSLEMLSETGQMDVYFYRDGKKVIAWSEGKYSSLRPGYVLLMREFLKAFGTVKK